MQRREFIKLPLFTGLLAMIPKLSYAAGVSLRCDITQGFNFQKNTHTPLGYITDLTISGKKFENNLTVQNPTDLDAAPNEKVVGVITNIRWNGGFFEPILFTCHVTEKNRETARILTNTNLLNTEVEFAFNVYQFDAGASTPSYYRFFHTNNKSLKGLIKKNYGDLEFEIDSEPSPEVPSPRNYELYLSVMPRDAMEQNLHLAVAKTVNLVKKWGVAVR